jgi:hypothetical protein
MFLFLSSDYSLPYILIIGSFILDVHYYIQQNEEFFLPGWPLFYWFLRLLFDCYIVATVVMFFGEPLYLFLPFVVVGLFALSLWTFSKIWGR